MPLIIVFHFRLIASLWFLKKYVNLLIDRFLSICITTFAWVRWLHTYFMSNAFQLSPVNFIEREFLSSHCFMRPALSQCAKAIWYIIYAAAFNTMEIIKPLQAIIFLILRVRCFEICFIYYFSFHAKIHTAFLNLPLYFTIHFQQYTKYCHLPLHHFDAYYLFPSDSMPDFIVWRSCLKQQTLALSLHASSPPFITLRISCHLSRLQFHYCVYIVFKPLRHFDSPCWYAEIMPPRASRRFRFLSLTYYINTLPCFARLSSFHYIIV